MKLGILKIILAAIFCMSIKYNAYGAQVLPFEPQDSITTAQYADSADFSLNFGQYIQHPDFSDWTASTDLTEDLQGFEIDTEALFSTIEDGNEHIQNGIFGPNYHRLQIFISNICKPINSRKFKITGADKRADEIYFFTGYLTIDKLLQYRFDTKESDNPEYVLTGHYEIDEEEPETGSGTFRGTFGIYIKVAVEYNTLKDELYRIIRLNADNGVADEYANRTYVGTWTSHTTGTTMKAIWGDGRLPYTFDFDCGAGEMVPCDKYIDEGWESYLKGDEYKEVKDEDGTVTGYELKNKWWK